MPRHPDHPPGFRLDEYNVKVIKRQKTINVLCPVCVRHFEIKKYGIVNCPWCKSKLEFTEKK